MRPLVNFADAQLVTIELLRTLIAADATATTTDAVVGSRTPQGKAEPPRAAPYIMVRLTSSSTPSIIEETDTLRVSVWAATEAKGLALAKWCRNHLLAYGGDAELRGFQPLVGPIPTDDPESGAPLSFFTITARLRPLSE